MTCRLPFTSNRIHPRQTAPPGQARIATGYGQTENGGQASAASGADTAEGPGSSGPPMPCVELKIDPRTGLPDGEILIRRPTQMSGYVAADNASALSDELAEAFSRPAAHANELDSAKRASSSARAASSSRPAAANANTSQNGLSLGVPEGTARSASVADLQKGDCLLIAAIMQGVVTAYAIGID
jgi:acyl-CoA synthetase (AMP-forming)/AMP-acid ligase II